MKFPSILKALKSRPASPIRSSPRRRLSVETLEDRSLPSGMVSLAVNDDSILVGERVTWTATASGVGAAPVYQFSAAAHGGTFHVLRDYSPVNNFTWTPMQEGDYDIEVTVKDGYQGAEAASAVVTDGVTSRVTGSQAVVTPTANPLVALYSVPPSSAESVRVQFALAGDNNWRNTATRAVVPGASTNFFVAGMLPNTTYQMRHVFGDGTGSATTLFTTGALPATLTFPTYTVPQFPGPDSDSDQDMVFHSLVFTGPDASVNSHPLATDLSGRVVWYYDIQQSGLGLNSMLTASLLPGGTVIGMGRDRYSVRNNFDVLREIDLAGNPVRETNLAAVNAQLTAMGHEIIYGFHHEARRLPDGSLIVLGLTERSVSINGTPTYYIGEETLVLDRDFHIKWTWDAFDHLDVNRGPVLGEITLPGVGPTSVVPVLPAVDWLHVNAVTLSPTDGNLILSMRHQDWVIKIDYRNGAGDGHVVWKLGQDGDFTANSADPHPWFSHQHNAHFIDDHTMILFDNGNTRRAGDPNAHSRGQVWTIDEQTMTATLVVSADLGRYSAALGAAERLSNGNYSFTLGTDGPEPVKGPAHTVEVTPDGVIVYDLQVNKPEYRAYRVRTLYEGVDDALAGAPSKVESVVLNDGSAQRSMINRITVTFDGVAILDPGAIELRRQNGSLVEAQVSIAVVDGKTVAVLTFAGAEFVGGSLSDGTYTLTVRADRVHDRWGRELDGDGNGAAGGDSSTAFFRLFGDSDGDRDVDVRDLVRFVGTLGRRAGDAGYLWYFDVNGDDRVGVIDAVSFLLRLGTHL